MLLFPLISLWAVFVNAQSANVVLRNAKVYTVDKNNPSAEAIAIKDDKILFVGSEKDVKKFIGKETEVVDCKGNFVTPGWIEGHGHIHGLGASLISLNLMNVKNWEEIVSLVAEAVKKAKPGDWIVGRGWHQEKWTPAPQPNYLGYPYYETLDKVSPDNPVILTHSSGHSSYVNGMALKLAGITEKTPDPSGGSIVKDKEGKILGVLEERAQNLVGPVYYGWLNKRSLADRKAEWANSIRLAEEECLKNGITTFVDAGSGIDEAKWLKELADNNKLSIRHWVMIRTGISQLKANENIFNVRGSQQNHLTIKSIKVSLDGALGSYGAWLLEPYTDRGNFYGQNTFKIEELKQIAEFAWNKDLQLCVHAIGDRANRETIDIYAEQINKSKTKDHRWRVEHAQHVNLAEIPRFKEYNIIASMQGIHCTSDAPFVPKRLGDKRAEEGAYVWRKFMDAGVLVNNGTDVPVENIDPIANYYASVTRKLKDGSTFYADQKMTRPEAIYSYTLANAIASFEDKEKGSITKGKLADIVMFSNNLITCSDDEINSTKILMTIVGGKIKYKK